MYPYVTINGIMLPTYFLCSAAGICIAMVVLSRLLIDRFLFCKYIKIIFYSMIGLFVGAKLFGTISWSLSSLYNKGSFNLSASLKNSGIVYWGGLLGFLSFFWCLCKWKEERDIKEVGNILAIVIPLFHVFGRIGCYFGGCCYGKKYNKFGAVLYRIGKKGKQILRFPTQPLEAGFEFVFFLILYYVYKKKKDNGDGKLLIIYMYGYSIFRFVVEFWRGDSERGIYGFFSFSQIVCVFVIGCLLANYITGMRRKKKNENI